MQNLFDRNGKQFIDGSIVDMVEWYDTNGDTVKIKVVWNKEQAKFEAQNIYGIVITDMKSLVGDGVVAYQ